MIIRWFFGYLYDFLNDVEEREFKVYGNFLYFFFLL